MLKKMKVLLICEFGRSTFDLCVGLPVFQYSFSTIGKMFPLHRCARACCERYTRMADSIKDSEMEVGISVRLLQRLATHAIAEYHRPNDDVRSHPTHCWIHALNRTGRARSTRSDGSDVQPHQPWRATSCSNRHQCPADSRYWLRDRFLGHPHG